jgi:hypothetical protein
LSDIDWTDELEKDVAYRWLVLDHTTRRIAKDLYKSKSSVYRCIERLDLKGERGNVGLYEVLFTKVTPVIRPVSIRARKAGKVLSDRVDHVSLHTSDIHFPFQDNRALDVVYKVTEAVKPSILVDHGDAVDCYQLSTHRPPDERKMRPEEIDLQCNINDTAAHFALMHELAQPERSVYLGGNHEDRHERILGEMRRDPRMKHILSLEKVEEYLKWENIMGLDSLGIEYRSYHDHGDPVVLFDRIVLSHGHLVNKWVTRAMMDSYGKSTMFGHTHRIQNWTERNLKGQESSWNIGCLCDINPHYMPFANWHQGFAVIYWSKTDAGWIYDVHQLRIHEGKTIFQGNKFAA